MVKNLLNNITPYLTDQIYNTNNSLLLLAGTCNKIQSLNFNCPLSKIATGLGLIIGNLSEFNVILPRAQKLTADYDKII